MWAENKISDKRLLVFDKTKPKKWGRRDKTHQILTIISRTKIIPHKSFGYRFIRTKSWDLFHFISQMRIILIFHIKWMKRYCIYIPMGMLTFIFKRNKFFNEMNRCENTNNKKKSNIYYLCQGLIHWENVSKMMQ